jgi:hypothetical protein
LRRQEPNQQVQVVNPQPIRHDVIPAQKSTPAPCTRTPRTRTPSIAATAAGQTYPARFGFFLAISTCALASGLDVSSIGPGAPYAYASPLFICTVFCVSSRSPTFRFVRVGVCGIKIQSR